ncbi:MAG: hypothetical protein F8N15_03835 [Methanobacterium sp.]|nr:hypothetical protein [Methanobacterium sp.]
MGADANTVLGNGVKLIGEAFLPGASLLLDGQLGNGVAHAVIGFGARLALGPVGLLVVAADSYSKSVTRKYLWEHLGDAVSAKKPLPPESDPAAGPAHRDSAVHREPA